MAKHNLILNSEREGILRLRDGLRKSIRPREGTIPSGELLRELQEKWLPVGAFICRNQAEGCDPSLCHNRCSAVYWLSHCEAVASLMQTLAEVLGDDPEIYQAAGKVHDLDYVKAPHDLGSTSVSSAHPVPLVKDLMEMGAPPILSLAVLEHSPHLNLEPSSPLSDALIACDDAATLASTGYDLAGEVRVPLEIIKRLASAPRGSVSGKYRHGMPKRMIRAFAALSNRNYHFPGVSRNVK